MKKIIAILLALVIAVYNFGSIAVYNIQQYFIRLESVRAINNADEIPSGFIVTLNFLKAQMKPENGFLWRNGREFTFRGNMYDIILKKSTGMDSVSFVCFFDLKETINRNNYVEHYSEDPKNPPIKAKLKPFQIELFCNQIINYNEIELYTKRYSPNYVSNYKSNYIKPTEPPPKSLSVLFS